MKKVLAICLAMGLLLAFNGMAQADQIWDNPGYVASTNLVLGAYGSDYYGNPGYVIDQEFQLNLLYQAGVNNDDIDAFNNYQPLPEGSLNFPDPEEYVLRIDENGGLPVLEYPDGTQSDYGAAYIQWTLTGWGQTILAGSIVDQGDGSYFFQVLPTGTYRPFPNDPPVNDVEVFSGQVATEVLGYTFYGELDNFGEGSTLVVTNTPLPGTLALLGTGLAGLAFLRRRRVFKR